MITKNPEIFRKMNEMGHHRIPFLFLIDFEGEQALVIPLEEASSLGIWYDIGHDHNHPFEGQTLTAPELKKTPIGFETYRKAFDRVMHHIHRGDTYLLNLTFETPLQTEVDLEEIFRLAHARYKVLFRDEFVVFSPEIFVKIENGRIRSFPMKGTIDAAIPGAEERILSDPKELAEHHTIVDLIRNDLSIVATNVRVERFRYIEEIRTNQKHLLQVSSEICGDLPEDHLSHLGDIFSALLPAGSITGAPKKKTLEIIKRVEIFDRKFYTGVCGVFDGNKVDSGVMIRFIEKTPGGMVFKSGGGITFRSDVNKEYQELIDKVYVPVV